MCIVHADHDWKGKPMAKTRVKRKSWLKEDTAALKQYSRQKLPIAKVVKLMKRTAAMLQDCSPQDVAAHANMRGVYRQWVVAA